MTFYTYILYSELLLRYYTGQTNNLEERIKRHNKCLVKSTKNGTPWRLVYSVKFGTRSESLLFELKIKKRGAKRFLESLET